MNSVTVYPSRWPPLIWQLIFFVLCIVFWGAIAYIGLHSSPRMDSNILMKYFFLRVVPFLFLIWTLFILREVLAFLLCIHLRCEVSKLAAGDTERYIGDIKIYSTLEKDWKPSDIVIVGAMAGSSGTGNSMFLQKLKNCTIVNSGPFEPNSYHLEIPMDKCSWDNGFIYVKVSLFPRSNLLYGLFLVHKW